MNEFNMALMPDLDPEIKNLQDRSWRDYWVTVNKTAHLKADLPKDGVASIAKGYRVRGLFQEAGKIQGLVYLPAISTWFASTWDPSGKCLTQFTGDDWRLIF